MNKRRNSYFYVLFPQALDRLSPVTHSVANTLKRVLIIVATCVVFKTPISTLGMVGSGVAVLVSSLCCLVFVFAAACGGRIRA